VCVPSHPAFPAWLQRHNAKEKAKHLSSSIHFNRPIIRDKRTAEKNAEGLTHKNFHKLSKNVTKVLYHDFAFLSIAQPEVIVLARV